MLGELIGKGAFGKVYHSLNDSGYVYKVINDEFKIYYENEIETLKIVKNCEKCCNLIDKIKINDSIYLKFKKYECNFREYKDIISINQLFKLSKQMLEGVEFLESNNIIHGDLKPENIMFEDNSYDNIKIIDFGSSVSIKNKIYYNYYFQTRWYCSPDVILGKELNSMIDLWSIGCIMYEIFYKKVLFKGEKSEQDNRRLQLIKIIEYLGIPSKNYLLDCKLKNKYFDDKLTLKPKSYNYNLISNFNNEIIKPGSKKLEDIILDKNILKILKLIFKYEDRDKIVYIKDQINELIHNKKIKK
jgi:serine/threonine protein kinase